MGYRDDLAAGGGDDDDESSQASRKFSEFDCPDCDANNPTDSFSDGDEVRCHYCGSLFSVKVGDSGRLKFRSA